ncbi:class II aldolase/adducin family protein [Fodinisporobacter ferrooxydans]|uniref:Class II aldolase/adducin family protein n=1 Tax=Fodinisporobacter ferrooxydans TaxID=2901836 RepID=A0ABY4CIS2_9BACL|nr:class II aldolase/adducin family protein [Alicyclobacillaceae bacterium MYW30-H2]
MSNVHLNIREELCSYATRIVKKGLVAGPGGNISARSGDIMYISPSGFALDEIPADKWISVDIATGEVEGELRPSSETLLHLFIYRVRPDIYAVIHAHPIYSIAVSSVDLTVPPMFADFVAILGDLPCLEYVMPTTRLLAERVVEDLGQANAMLLRNHGTITVGSNLKEAYYRTEILEDAAKIYILAKQLGSPRVLTEEECRQIKELDSEVYRVNLLKDMKV